MIPKAVEDAISILFEGVCCAIALLVVNLWLKNMPANMLEQAIRPAIGLSPGIPKTGKKNIETNVFRSSIETACFGPIRKNAATIGISQIS